MKKLIVASFISIFAITCIAGEPVLKKACIDKVGKDKKVFKECRTIKTHKKLESTHVPVKK